MTTRPLACNQPGAYALTRTQEARMEAQAQRKRRRELLLGVAAAVQALVAFEAGNGREVEARLLEAEGFLTQNAERPGG
jgi:hypothetical protein